jgi:hypothetical protein
VLTIGTLLSHFARLPGLVRGFLGGRSRRCLLITRWLVEAYASTAYSECEGRGRDNVCKRKAVTMATWCRYPTIYEISTWAWLTALSDTRGTPVNLLSVPAAEWDAIAKYGFDAVWLMGVWERSPAGITIANANEGLLADFRRALPDFRPADNVGSPYCVRNYLVDRRLGGPDGLAAARRELARRGMRLILDFVPNHVAPDHPWVVEHPDYFVSGSAEDAHNDPAAFAEMEGAVFARGRDPFFPPWPDVLQLNVFRSGVRAAVIETIRGIARQCDGIRCDMAMLVLNEIFERTWGGRAGPRPGTEYWVDVISAVKAVRPDFLFIGEAYWDKEWELQQQGFDFCYDKRLYDRLEHDPAEQVRLHLCAEPAYQDRLVRFIENHDEPRAAAAFAPDKACAAAVTMATVPGARLFHEGQFEGRTVRLPVFLGRRPEEPVNQPVRIFYDKLLRALDAPAFRDGQWGLCACTGWPDNPTHRNLVAWTWQRGDEHYLIVVNLSDRAAQARVRGLWDDTRGRTWRLVDLLSGKAFDRSGDEMADEGLYVDLGGWGFHFFQAQRN